MKDKQKKQVLRHIMRDDKDFKKQISEDKELAKSLKKEKKK